MADMEAKTQNSEMAGRDQKPKNPFFSLFQKPPFLDLLPWKPQKSKPEPLVSEKLEEQTKGVVVKLPGARPEIPPLKLEAEEAEQNTNPVVLWQVYAIGGFFLAKWLWARWNERRIKKNSSDEEEPSPADE